MATRPPRNIVVCCDGTSNEFASDLTNVAKLTYALVKNPATQHVYYQPGLGTRAAPGFPLPVSNRLARIAGLAFGYGIKEDIRDAYIFIMNHWQPGDRLFLFGFSRGAYTVRALASLIHMYGIAMPGNEMLIPYAIRMMWKLSGAQGEKAKRGFELARRYRDSLSMADCPIHFLGVWDTVSSVGWVSSPVSLPFTRCNPDILHVRHAVSIDERRAFFRTNLFEMAEGQTLAQVWFPGDHCDVGGGHPESASGLSKIPLQWMIDEAEEAGLLIDRQHVLELLGETVGSDYSKASATAPRHGKIPWYWLPAELVPKRHWDRERKVEEWRMNLARKRTYPPLMHVHHSAWDIPGYSSSIPQQAERV